MTSKLISILTEELKKLDGDFIERDVTKALTNTVTTTLKGNEAKVILRRVVEPEGKIALTELELRDDFIHLYPDEVEALRSMLLIWDEDSQPRTGDLWLVSQRRSDGTVNRYYGLD